MKSKIKFILSYVHIWESLSMILVSHTSLFGKKYIQKVKRQAWILSIVPKPELGTMVWDWFAREQSIRVRATRAHVEDRGRLFYASLFYMDTKALKYITSYRSRNEDFFTAHFLLTIRFFFYQITFSNRLWRQYRKHWNHLQMSCSLNGAKRDHISDFGVSEHGSKIL